jgi:L-alanine-DL-glutamate epimerase-like enolase superfamily enzyme
MATPNFVALEYKVESSLPWLPEAAVPWRDAILVEPLELHDCALVLSDAPGLGIELDWDACLAHPAPERRLTLPLQRDGAIAEY